MSFTAQTTLTEDAPLILDATCSYGKLWPASATVRIDIRPEVRPDLVMDARELKFPDAFFDEVYCDPPHMVRANLNKESIKRSRRIKGYRFGQKDMFDRYGLWASRAEWLDFIAKTNIEFHRVLKPTGVLHYKVCVGRKDNVWLSDVTDGMTLFEIIDSQARASKTNVKTVKSQVYFLTMKPTAIKPTDTKDGGIGGR